MKSVIISIVLGFGLTACAPTKTISLEKTKSPLPETCSISWVELADERPKRFEKLGSVSYADSGFTTTSECTKEKIRELIRRDACSAGANTVIITESYDPSFWGSTCFRISGDLGNI